MTSATATLGDLDLYLFGEGNHYRIYQKLGAHLTELDGVPGTRFAVWAPNAARVSVVGPFNMWDGRKHLMQMRGSSGIWELFIPGVGRGTLYKYELATGQGSILLKADPYGVAMQLRPQNCSVVESLDEFSWQDAAWVGARATWNPLRQPISIYEVHLGSWRRPWQVQQPPFMSWRDAVDQLIPYVLDMGFTHIELMGVAEHPLDESWGYQIVGYYAATARYGTPEDFMFFVDRCHQAGIGVILDWVPAHFPRDDHGLAHFDGTALYEHADRRLGEHMDWGTKIFNFGRHEVKNFLIANALFWLDKFHVDGLRVDAVASMLYLDYSREQGQWLPNRYGGRENIEAIDFLKHLNSAVRREFPGALTIAEESTSFPGVTQSTDFGGLGFTFKWNMGWMNDTLRYMSLDPVHRRHEHQRITFSFVYAWSEKFLLPLSHDEVVHGKCSLAGKMPGDDWQKLANLRLLLAYMTAHPGKKLLFMGSEFAQWQEWRDAHSLDWQLLMDARHQGVQALTRALNAIYKASPQLFGSDSDHDGFQWVEVNNANDSVWAFLRKATHGDRGNPYICVFNATPVPRPDYYVGIPDSGEYKKIFDSDSHEYGGSGYNGQSLVKAEQRGCQGFPFALRLGLPPLAGVFYCRQT
jgi:1,4-alpha-glucan branching enzyme